MRRESLTINLSRSLLSSCLDVFKGIFNALPYHAKEYRLGAGRILHHLGAKTHTKMIKRALKGYNKVLGKGDKGEDTF